MFEELKKRRDEAAMKNCFVLFEKLNKSTQDWESRLTGVQHWKPEDGYEVYVFDPNNIGATYILFRRWNEESRTFDEKMIKHATGYSEASVAVDKTKEWVFDNWEELKSFKNDKSDDDVDDEKVKEEPKEEPEADEKQEDTPSKTENSFDEAMEEAFENVTEEKETKFRNFLDNGVATEEEREEMWKHPWIRRIATQLDEMGKDYSQFERTLQNSKERREQALAKSLYNLNSKIEQISTHLQKKVPNV